MSWEQIASRPVAVLQGGTSAEREVSLNSGATVIAALKGLGCDVRPVDPADADWIAQLQGVGSVFNALHGPGGEDGVMQGALTALGLPYTGSGVLGSAMAMDKQRSKQLWQGIGIPTGGFELLAADTDWQGVIDRLGKVFVKPACEGSSIGMAPAASAAELKAAWQAAAKYGDAVLAEKFINGPEYTVSILGDAALPSIRMETDNTFYDYDAKYLSDDTRYHCPSGLSDADEAEVAAIALAAFRSLGCAVWGRVDLMRDADGRFYVLEVNTIPGMTSHSLVPMAAKVAGMDIQALVRRILELSWAARAAGEVDA
ncbi:D-alanine--D-alanine ligase [Parahaliea mediterranea]|uniref:D-alanine--D-alanine ligase n=1 Tax=Parahaliea mediterranea TaxID=651086 RepID=UPI000E2E552E|nr:D-alanine--D-alanine ligase [Parahaliea mediterranea]